MTPFDGFLAFVLCIGMTAWAHREHSRLEFRLSSGRSRARLEGYRRVIFVQWSLVGLLGLHWVLTSRPASALGLRLPLDWRAGVGILLVAAGVAFLWHQLQEVRRDDSARAAARRQIADLRALLPHTPRELEAFYRVSITAGICEELLYRGFLVWFLGFWMPAWAGYLVAGAVFGTAHFYQGPAGILKTGAFGVILGLLTWLSGTILPAMVLHAAIDMLNGQLAYVALTTPVFTTEEPGEAPEFAETAGPDPESPE
jgi:membrane protease YdiL (CAAX protease family)